MRQHSALTAVRPGWYAIHILLTPTAGATIHTRRQHAVHDCVCGINTGIEGRGVQRCGNTRDTAHEARNISSSESRTCRTEQDLQSLHFNSSTRLRRISQPWRWITSRPHRIRAHNKPPSTMPACTPSLPPPCSNTHCHNSPHMILDRRLRTPTQASQDPTARARAGRPTTCRMATG